MQSEGRDNKQDSFTSTTSFVSVTRDTCMDYGNISLGASEIVFLPILYGFIAPKKEQSFASLTECLETTAVLQVQS